MAWDRVAIGLCLLLLVGPALWAPSLFRWQFRTQNRRVRALAALIGEQGARYVYVALGGFVSLVGVWFIGTAANRASRPLAPARSPIASAPHVPTTLPARVLTGLGAPVIRGLVLSPDGASVLTGARALREWEVASGDLRREIALETLGAPARTQIDAMAASADHQWIVLGFGNGTIHCGNRSLRPSLARRLG